MCTINHNHMMNDSLDIKQMTEFFIILGHFCPLTLLTIQKIKILKKLKKTLWGIIILDRRTKNHDHMLYCPWDMAHDGCNCYFSFWAIFCPFTPLTVQKMKSSKKLKKTPGYIITLHKCNKNHDHMLYCSWDMVCDGCNCTFHFGLFFALLPP